MDSRIHVDPRSGVLPVLFPHGPWGLIYWEMEPYSKSSTREFRTAVVQVARCGQL